MSGVITCNERVTKAVADLVRIAVPPVTAAAAQGVDKPTFEHWMQRGELRHRGYWRYQRFRHEVMTAEADCEVALVARVRAAAQEGEWQAAIWLAERRFGDRWLRRSVNAEPTDAPPQVSATAWSQLDEETNVTPIRRK
jgi:hypothetical protein